MTVIQTFRDTMRLLSVPWLRRGYNEKLLYAIGLHADAFGDALVAGVKLRFPGVYSDESLPLIGRERRIRRGRTETTATYAVRLTRWLTDHRRRGGPYAMLAQLWAHYAPANFVIELISRNRVRYTMSTTLDPATGFGVVTRDTTSWTLDSITAAKWARWQLVFHWPNPVSASGHWDDDPELWDSPTTVWDSDLTPQEIEDIRLIPKEWNAAHTTGTVTLVDSLAHRISFSIG